MTSIAPFGSWRSPMTAGLIAASDIGLAAPAAAGDVLFWTEVRPLEAGRYVIVRRDPGGAIADVTPAGFNARTLVHEYGGGMYTLYASRSHGRPRPSSSPTSTISVSTGRSCRGGRQPPSRRAPSRPSRASPRALRYADARVTPDGGPLICVRERHDGRRGRERARRRPHGRRRARRPRRPATTSTPRRASARTARGWPGSSWDHPAMPWDETELWVAELTAGGELAAERRVAGGPGESVLQPAWSPGRPAALRERPQRLVEPVPHRRSWPQRPRRRASAASRFRPRRSPRCRGVRQARPGSSACRTTPSCPTARVLRYLERGGRATGWRLRHRASAGAASGQHRLVPVPCSLHGASAS